MDSRRDPAVLLLIKTVVITFPILLEPGLCGATAWHAENVFLTDRQQRPSLLQEGYKHPSLQCAEGDIQGSVELEKGGSISGTV